jgi:hypothetical protein
MEICKYVQPKYKEVEEGHFCACHLYNTEEENANCVTEMEEIKVASEENKGK